MNNLWNEISGKLKELSFSINKLHENGQALAKAERDYKVALKKEIVTLHEVENVAWTACTGIAHGDIGENQVARKRYERDIAKTLYEVGQEKINGLKLEIRILESQLSREWGNTK